VAKNSLEYGEHYLVCSLAANLRHEAGILAMWADGIEVQKHEQVAYTDA
jgi:hypothetical protein